VTYSIFDVFPRTILVLLAPGAAGVLFDLTPVTALIAYVVGQDPAITIGRFVLLIGVAAIGIVALPVIAVRRIVRVETVSGEILNGLLSIAVLRSS
jgi:hypothetical protein